VFGQGLYRSGGGSSGRHRRMLKLLSFHSCTEQQLDYVGYCGATHVFLTGGAGESIGARCRTRTDNNDALDTELNIATAWASCSNFGHDLEVLRPTAIFGLVVSAAEVIKTIGACLKFLKQIRPRCAERTTPNYFDVTGFISGSPHGRNPIVYRELARFSEARTSGTFRTRTERQANFGYAFEVSQIINPAIAFAHRGARAHAPENTLESFRLAIRLGATGLESDVWLTADGVAVLDHDGVVRQGMRKRLISDVSRKDLPTHIPTLEDLYGAVGTSHPLSLDVKDPGAFDAVIGVARSAGAEAVNNLWLCDPDWHRLVSVRESHLDVKLVDSTRLKRIEGPERRAAELSAAKITAINMHYSDWTPGLVALFHRFDLVCFGWDAQFPRMVKGLIDMRIDGLFSDDVEMMMSEFARRGAVRPV
jgi:glycerophosphoryl diester phosphodiesterase